MDYGESSPVTRGYRRFFEIYTVDIDRIPKFDQFVLALREALTTCESSAEKLKGRKGGGAGAPDIKAARIRLGLGLKELARRSGLSVLTIRGVERGKVRPQRGTLKKIVDALENAAASS